MPASPVTEGSRVFVVRDAMNPPEPPAGRAPPVVAIDLDTGGAAVAQYIPFASDDWTTWVAGVKNGLVFACRGDILHSARVRPHIRPPCRRRRCRLDQPGRNRRGIHRRGGLRGQRRPDHRELPHHQRIRWTDGTTVWTAEREERDRRQLRRRSFGDGVYISDYAYTDEPGGLAPRSIKYDLATGAKLYEGPIMPSWLQREHADVRARRHDLLRDGTEPPAAGQVLRVPRYRDGLVEVERPAGWSVSSEFGVLGRLDLHDRAGQRHPASSTQWTAP